MNHIRFVEAYPPGLGMDLSTTSLEELRIRYSALTDGEHPVSLLCSRENVQAAYDALTELRCVMHVVVVPGFPVDLWAVSGPQGVLYNMGA